MVCSSKRVLPGLQATVAALMRIQASPTLRTWAEEGGRPALSAADLASAGAHPGMSAWLAQSLLTGLLEGTSAQRRVEGVSFSWPSSGLQPHPVHAWSSSCLRVVFASTCSAAKCTA